VNISRDDLAELVKVIRFVPKELQDDAWRYAASRLRPIREPTSSDVGEVCRELIRRYLYDKGDIAR
jgi:hypothetical protein